MTREYRQGGEQDDESGDGEVTAAEPQSTATRYKAAPAAASVHITANSDAQAVGQWLNEYTASAQTFRAYRKEAERLLLWLEAQQLSLADVDRRRLDEFEHFLTDPQPVERWVGAPRPRAHPEWRPFRRPLTVASRRQSLVILQGLFSWLVEAGWVAHNPFRLMRDKRRRLDNRREGIERYLERPLWDWLWQWLNRPPEEDANMRTRFLWQRRRLIFGFAYLLAPRISEIAAAWMGDFICREGRWWWRVVGKGDKLASIPVPADMLALLSEWREHLGLTALPEPEEIGPMLRGLDGKRGLGDNQLYRLIKTSFEDAAQEIEKGEGGAVFARTLRKATPHWLRHTAITHQAQSGIELRYLAKTARHSRLDTTARYLHAEANEWQQQMSAHRLEMTPPDTGSAADDGGHESL